MLFPTLKKKIGYKKNSGGGGFMLFSTLKKKILKSAPSLTILVKWEVVSPNSRWGQLESISIISSIPLF